VLPLDTALAAFMLLSMTVYMLTGGADFGGGVWDLLASGPRAKQQRELVASAIAPIWEANHVWLIVVVVVLFVAFPSAFALITTALHIPLAIMLVGIVLRGSAFAFRAYDDRSEQARERWSRMFAIGSILAPMMLGMTLAAVASGHIRIDPDDGHLLTGFVWSWLAAFPVVIGLLTVALCAFLAAVYLTLEATDHALQEDFRAKALRAAAAVALCALFGFLLSHQGAPLVTEGLSGRWWSIPLQLFTAVTAVGAIWALWSRRYTLARIFAMGQVAFIIWGWALSQQPFLVVPDVTIQGAAAPRGVLRAVAIALGVGLVVLVPSFWLLYRVFKRASRS
jgi:cytochrome d ubiquinol oxidase subunit II